MAPDWSGAEVGPEVKGVEIRAQINASGELDFEHLVRTSQEGLGRENEPQRNIEADNAKSRRLPVDNPYRRNHQNQRLRDCRVLSIAGASATAPDKTP
jgi:hypothetical protein